MPELPEVETVRRGLERTVVGKTIQSVEIVVAKIFPVSWALIDEVFIGATVVAADRRAKVLLLTLSTGWTLAIHLKMTGQLVVQEPPVLSGRRVLGTGFVAGHPEKAYQAALPHKHTHIIIQFTDGTTLFFNDLRKFGWMKLLAPTPASGAMSIGEFLQSLRLGPEPFDSAFTPAYLEQAATSRRVPIKTFLLDQSVVAGVGNIYADEALFRAHILPTRPAQSLTVAELRALHTSVIEILRLGIEHGGTTLNTYVDIEGSPGKMRDHLLVYGREGTPCSVCGSAIERMKIGARSSRYCPVCQR